jgi:hypothetical protein
MTNIIVYGVAAIGSFIVYKYTKKELSDIPLAFYQAYRTIYRQKIFKNALFEPHIHISLHEIGLDALSKKWNIHSRHYKSEDLDNYPYHYLAYDHRWHNSELVYIEYNILINDTPKKFYKEITSSQELDTYNNSITLHSWNESSLQPSKSTKFIDVRLNYNNKEYNIDFFNEYIIVDNNLLDKKFIIFYMKKYFNINVDDNLLKNIKTTIIDGDADYKELNSEQYIKITKEGYDII